MVSRDTLVEYNYLISRVSTNLHSLSGYGEVHIVGSFNWLNDYLPLLVSGALSFYLSIAGIFVMFRFDIIVIDCGLFLNQLFISYDFFSLISLLLFQEIGVSFQDINSFEDFSSVQLGLNIELFFNILFSQIQYKIPVYSHFQEIVKVPVHSNHL